MGSGDEQKGDVQRWGVGMNRKVMCRDGEWG